MFEVFAILLSLECHSVDARILVNDVEVAIREKCDDTKIKIDATPWLGAGLNDIIIQSRPAWGTGPAPRTPGAKPRLELSFEVPGSLQSTNTLIEAAKTRFSISLREANNLAQGRYSTIGRERLRLAPTFGTPSWMTGEKLSLDESVRNEAAQLVEVLAAVLERAQPAEIKNVLSNRLMREARQAGVDTDTYSESYIQSMISLAKRPGWRVETTPREGLEFSLHGAGRVLRVRSIGGYPPIRTFGENGQDAAYDMDLTKINGVWVLL